MRILCILGRHKWRVDNSDPERPFEVCDRCGHYRNDVDWAADERGNPGTGYPFGRAHGGGYVGGGDGGGGGGDGGGGM